MKKISRKVLQSRNVGSLIVAKKVKTFCFGIPVKKPAHTHGLEHQTSGLKSKHLTTRPRTPDLCDLQAETKKLSPGKTCSSTFPLHLLIASVTTSERLLFWFQSNHQNMHKKLCDREDKLQKHKWTKLLGCFFNCQQVLWRRKKTMLFVFSVSSLSKVTFGLSSSDVLLVPNTLSANS